MRALVFAVAIVVLVATAVAGRLAVDGDVGAAIFLLTVVSGPVALLGVVATLGRPAQLVAQRQHELGVADLIFFDSDPPREYLLQLHVAVANVGARTGVLSALYLDEFSGARRHWYSRQRRLARFGEFPLPMRAQVMRQTTRQGLKGGQPFRDEIIETSTPPLALERDDVVTLRFRARRAIDWSERWTIESLRTLADTLSTPVEGARLRLVYRQGTRVITARQRVDLRAVGQQQYVARLRQLTADFTARPALGPFQVTLE